MEIENERTVDLNSKKGWSRYEVLGTVILLLALATLFASPDTLADLFSTVVKRVKTPVIDVFLTGTVGVAIICSVIIGRLLERAGFTDALIRIFTPLMRLINVNSTVLIPSIYNILGDINAAGRIAGPALKKANATKDEQKMAIATMVQSQQSFSTLMLGLVAMSVAGIEPFYIVLLGVFGPLVIVPILLKVTLFRNTKGVSIQELPVFTPSTGVVKTLFDAAKESLELLLLIIIPAAAAVFVVIGVLDYAGVWPFIENGLSTILTYLYIDPESGMNSILVSPTLGMGLLGDYASTIDPRLVVGAFIISASGFPIATIFGQIPAIWVGVSDLNEKEIIMAATLGAGMRLVTAFVIAFFVTPFIIM